MGKVYPGQVEVRQDQLAQWYACITGPKGSKPRRPYIGPQQPTPERATADAARWLEDHGYVHPLTHDCD